MRFRLATTGQGGQQATEGFGRGMQSLFQLPMMEAMAGDQAQTTGLKRQLLESQIADHVAQAALRNRESDALGRGPDVLDTIVAGNAGTDVPTLNRWRQGVRTGVRPMTSASGDPETDVAIGIPPQPEVDPVTAQKLLTHFQRVAPGMINPKNLTVQGMASASGQYQTQDVLDQVLQGRIDPGRAGGAVAASKGSKQVENIGNTGAGFNIHSGQGTTLDAGLRTLFGEEGASRVQQHKASATNSLASAGQHNAGAGLANARRERVVGGYDKPVTIIDEDSGEASVTRLPTGNEPVTVGVAPSKKTGVDATNAKERNRVVRDVEKELVGAKDPEIQAEVDRRMARRGTAKPGAAPAAAPNVDMGKAAQIKADVKAGKITREAGIAQLRALGFK